MISATNLSAWISHFILIVHMNNWDVRLTDLGTIPKHFRVYLHGSKRLRLICQIRYGI